VVSRNFVAARHTFQIRVSGCIQSTSFCHRNQFFVFRNEHAQSSTLGPRLMFGGGFSQFRCRTSHIPNTGVGVHTKHKFLPPEPILRFSQRTCPIRYFRSKTNVWRGFTLYRCRTSPIPKTGVGVYTKHEFLPPELFLRFLQRTCPIHYFRTKTNVWGGFTQFVAARHPLRKRVSGAYKARVFATGTISSFFTTNIPNPLL
jgi:hypothetical protein